MKVNSQKLESKKETAPKTTANGTTTTINKNRRNPKRDPCLSYLSDRLETHL